MKGFAVLVACASMGNWGCQMQPTRGGALANVVEVLPVEHQPGYVIGFPMYVALTVRARPNASLNAVRFADLLDLHESIGVEIVRRGGGDSVSYEPVSRPRGDARPRGERLEPGETRRMLTDISPLVGRALADGEYDVRLSWVAAGEIFDAPPVMLRFRRPTADETARLASVAPDRGRYPTWGVWTRTCSEAPPQAVTVQQGDPLALNLILRRLFCSPVPANRIDPGALDSLGGLFAPERDALKAELYNARGDTAQARQLTDALARTHPGLAWWIHMVAAGGGYVTSFRNPVVPR
jgi:hypothetical protein